MKGGILNRIGFKAFESFSAKHYNFIIYMYIIIIYPLFQENAILT